MYKELLEEEQEIKDVIVHKLGDDLAEWCMAITEAIIDADYEKLH